MSSSTGGPAAESGPGTGKGDLAYFVTVAQRLSMARDLGTVQSIVRKAARELNGADGATFVLRDGDECYYADEDAIGPLWKGLRFPLNTCISGWAMLNRQPAIVEDIYTDDRIPIDAYRQTFVKSLVMVPIRRLDPIGAIGNYWAQKHAATQEEVSAIQALADITAVALENVQVYSELEQRVKDRTSLLAEANAGLSEQINQRKLVEAELRQSESKYRELVETMGEGVWVIDRDSRITYANAAMAKMLGYEPGEILGRLPFDFLSEPWRELMKSHIGLRQHGIASRYECEFVKKDGSTMRATLNAVPRFDGAGRYQGSFSVVEDITDQWKLEHELQDSEARYRAIITNMQGGVVLVDDTDRASFANGKAMEILGYTLEEMSAMATIDYVAPEEKERIGRVVTEWSNSAAPFVEADCWVVRKNEEKRYVHVRASHLNGDNKSLLVLNDITARKIAEDKLAALFENETQLRRELQSEIDKRIRFTHMLVHELKTPLTPIVSGSEMLSRQLTDGTVGRLARNIHTGAEELNGRVEELLQVARMEVGMLKLNIESVDIRSLIEQTIDYAAPLASGTGHTIDSHLSTGLPVINADPQRLRQVLLNLITNAIKYTPAGCTVSLNAAYQNGTVTIEVQDNGPGIGEQDKTNLFDPYYRMERNQADLGGLGLGLPISRNIVRLHGGEMSVESEANHGATFRFTLPVNGPATPEGEGAERR